MNRLLAAFALVLACSAVATAQQPAAQPEQPAPQAQQPPQPAPAEQPAPQPMPQQPMPPQPTPQEPMATQPEPMPEETPEATEEEEPATVWLLEDREWDFEAVASVYQPVRGIYSDQTRSAVWMLELARDLFAGEAGMHTTMQGTPFRLVMLDADRTVVEADLPMKITTVTGKQGDRVLLSVLFPDGGSLDNVATIRVERRTKIGFPLTDVLVDPAQLSRPIVVPEP